MTSSNPNFWTTTHASSKDEAWTTPASLWTSLNEEFGFRLDAAALASSTLVPGNWYGPDHPKVARRDALSRCWRADTSGPVWLNPPYARGVTGQFVAKAAAEAADGLTVVVLVPARTDTAWWHDHVIGTCEIRFLRGRLKFGGGSTPAPFPSAILVYAP